MNRVSVVMIARNAESTIAETIESVLTQTKRAHEIIVVNDGSIDRTREIASCFPVKILDKVHDDRGIGVVRNVGFAAATGDLFLPLDSDDILAPTFLEKTVPLMVDEVGIVCTDMQYFGIENNYIKSWSILGREMTFEDECHYNNIPVSSLIRRSAFEQVGGYHPELPGHEDWNLWISILAKGWKVGVIHEPLFFYRRRHNSLADSDTQRGKLLDAKMREIHGDVFRP